MMTQTVQQWHCRQCYAEFWSALSETVVRCPYCNAQREWLDAGEMEAVDRL